MKNLLRILFPLLVWLASFSAIYALHGLGCALGWSNVALPGMSLFRWLLLVSWLIALLAQGAMLMALRSRRFRSHDTFIHRTSLATSCAGLISTLWTLLPVAVSGPCG